MRPPLANSRPVVLRGGTWHHNGRGNDHSSVALLSPTLMCALIMPARPCSCSIGPSTASPPGENATARHDQAGQSRTRYRAWDRRQFVSDFTTHEVHSVDVKVGRS